MSYKPIQLKEEIRIHRIVSIHYFEYMSDFTFPGESHNFWEFLYVDKGEVEVTADREKLVLNQGQIIFHRPNEFHALAANHVIAPNLVVISFDAGDPCMAFFENKLLTVGESERNLLAQIIAEARDAFDGPMDDPYMQELTRREDVPFGCEQMIKLHLEQFLLQLYRNFSGGGAFWIEPESENIDAGTSPWGGAATGAAGVISGKTVSMGYGGGRPSLSGQDAQFGDLLAYLEKNICQQLTVEKICRDNLISMSQLKKLFHARQGCGVIEYFNQMKITAAKQLIRNQQMNFTQIADFLGYTSVHYFSRQFKKIADMTPTEYRASILLRAKRPERHL